jgi:predicted Fe-Mo cluster-binding NifX family protein
MTKRLVIPVEDKSGLDAEVSHHFGRAPYFAVIDLDEKGQALSIKTEPNTGEHRGGTGHPHDSLLALKPDVIVAFGMGPGGLHSFQNSGVTVLRAVDATVKATINSFRESKLTELAGGCEHAHHHNHEHS